METSLTRLKSSERGGRLVRRWTTDAVRVQQNPVWIWNRVQTGSGLTGQDVGVSVLGPVDRQVGGIVGQIQANALQLLENIQSRFQFWWRTGPFLNPSESAARRFPWKTGLLQVVPQTAGRTCRRSLCSCPWSRPRSRPAAPGCKHKPSQTVLRSSDLRSKPQPGNAQRKFVILI